MKFFSFSIVSLLLCVFSYSQVVPFDSIKINGILPFNAEIHELKRAFTIDSIVSKPKDMDMLAADSLIYVGTSYFAYYPIERSYVAEVVVFDSKITSFVIGKDTLNAKTTFEDIRRLFPDSCESTEPIKLYGSHVKYETCRTPLGNNDGNAYDLYLMFFFSEGYLKRIDIWEPC